MKVEFHVPKSFLLGALVLITAALSISPSHSRTATATTGLAPADDAGAIVGVISYVGVPPRRIRIDTSADAVCSQKNPSLVTEDNVVRRGKLANVFVYLKDGITAEGKRLSDLTFAVPTSDVTLDQKGCRFVPRVLGMQVRQRLRITNSDPTQHNIHPTPRNNAEWNQTQANGAPPLYMSFPYPEVLVPVKCNQHPWMKAYVGVLRHPFFAVSDGNGSFEIRGVPPGTYTLVAWHEGGARGTEQTKQIKVDAKGSVAADFAFGGSADSRQQPSLKVLTAIKLP